MKLRRIILGLFLFQCVVYAQYGGECVLFSDPNFYIDDPNALDNGLFECGDPNLTIYDFTPPIIWKRFPHSENNNQDDCYAGLDAEFTCITRDGEWHIPGPYEGNTFVVLSTEDLDGSNSSKGSMISQRIFLSPGDAVMGAYFFGAKDYRPYNDYGGIQLTKDPNVFNTDDPNPDNFLPGTYCDVITVGDYQSTFGLSPETNGWFPFTYVFDANEPGFYYLRCQVVNHIDQQLSSYYAVDNLRICRGGQPPADLNEDCRVNLFDYSILSEAWMAFCPDIPIDDPNFPGDPNDYPSPVTDPNIACQLADIDNSWFVDANDLNIMSEEWLFNGNDPNSF